ncbi:MAG: hypothetical protein OEY89_16145 [Gammaproteobacteria bacterium]|nr:hypothetical protein [Gammaproteobacteria bacterium]
MKELTSLGIRLSGLILIVYTLSSVPMYYLSYISQLENSAITYSLPILVPLIAGLVLFKFPNTFSDAFIKIETNNLGKPEITEYLYLGLVLIGFILFFYALSDIVFHISNYFWIKNFTEIEPTLMNFDYPSVIATIIELIFSMAIIIKTKPIIQFVKKHNER